MTTRKWKRTRIRKNDLKLATWNVLSLRRVGALQNLKNQLIQYHIDIAALQEMRWKENCITDSGEFTIFSSSSGSANMGTGFMVHRKYKAAVLNFEPIDGRICTLRLKMKMFNLTIICTHAPTEETDDETKDTFYEMLERTYKKTPSHDVKLIMGDMNAQVGQEVAFRPFIGKHSLHEVCNANGLRLVDFAIGKNLSISSTHFQHKSIHKATWKSPDGVTSNQIDHVLIDRRHGSDIIDVKTCRGADADSDHFLVVAVYRQRISTTRNVSIENNKKFNMRTIIQDADKRKECQQHLKEKLLTLNLNQDTSIEEHWKKIKVTIGETLEEKIGFEGIGRRNAWFDYDCEKAVKERNEARLKMLQRMTRTTKQIYETKRRIAKKLCRKKKREQEKLRLRDLENCREEKEARKMYKGIRELKKGWQPQTNLCRDELGNLIGDQTKVLNRWKTFFQELLNSHTLERGQTIEPEGVEDGLTHEPTRQDVARAIKMMNNNRTPGEDKIPAEIFKYGGPVLTDEIYKLISKIWTSEIMPDEWNVAVLVPIHKKGDKSVCSNYRGISLLNTGYKIFSKILNEKLKPYAEALTGEYQCGFRNERATTDQMFTLRLIMEKCYEYNQTIHQLYVDFRAAYDSVLREELFAIMSELKIPKKLISLTKLTLSNSRCKIRTNGMTSEEFVIQQGLKQGDALSCTLFNITLEGVMRKLPAPRGGTIFNRTTQNLAFADDIVMLATDTKYLAENLNILEKEATKTGLSINLNKTKYMINTRNGVRWRNVKEFQGYERVAQFKYLGGIITENNERLAEIKARLAAGNRCYYSFQNLLKTSLINKNLKLTIYKTIIKPIVIYGSETWSLTKKEETLLSTWERKILRKIFGAVNVNGEWRIRNNSELQQLYDAPMIIADIKARRLRWLGHVQRMKEQRIPKKILHAKPEGRRSAGRPRLRWLDDVEADLRKLGVRNWKQLAMSRSEWRTEVIDKARVLQGL